MKYKTSTKNYYFFLLLLLLLGHSSFSSSSFAQNLFLFNWRQLIIRYSTLCIEHITRILKVFSLNKYWLSLLNTYSNLLTVELSVLLRYITCVVCSYINGIVFVLFFCLFFSFFSSFFFVFLYLLHPEVAADVIVITKYSYNVYKKQTISIKTNASILC